MKLLQILFFSTLVMSSAWSAQIDEERLPSSQRNKTVTSAEKRSTRPKVVKETPETSEAFDFNVFLSSFNSDLGETSSKKKSAGKTREKKSAHSISSTSPDGLAQQLADAQKAAKLAQEEARKYQKISRKLQGEKEAAAQELSDYKQNIRQEVSDVYYFMKQNLTILCQLSNVNSTEIDALFNNNAGINIETIFSQLPPEVQNELKDSELIRIFKEIYENDTENGKEEDE